jgi:hypothetical protein
MTDDDPRDIPEPTDPELLYFKNRRDEFVPVAKYSSRVMKRTRKMARKPTGIPYFGLGAEWHDRWAHSNLAPEEPMPHADWDQEGFVKGGYGR